MTDYHPCLPIPTGLTSGQVHAREVGPWKPTYKHLVMTMWPMVSNALMISGILLLILDSVMSSGDKRTLYSRLLHLEPSLLVVMGLFLANFISSYWTGFWDSKPFLRKVWVMRNALKHKVLACNVVQGDVVILRWNKTKCVDIGLVQRLNLVVVNGGSVFHTSEQGAHST